ncbi:MAG: hypothetical protein K1Y01_15905 [Vicinamibacteria bacterium]|nr:hypothetical protein [Vicinamibacteria bacterium]
MNITSGLTLGQIFNRAMELFRREFARPALSILLPLALVSGLLSAAMTAVQTQLATNPGLILVFFGALILAGVIGVVGYGALAHMAVGLAAGRETAPADSWRAGLRFRAWGTLMLQGLGVGVGLIFCLLPGMYFGLVWAMALPVVFEEPTFAHSAALSRSHELSRFNPAGGLGNDPRFRIFLIFVVTLATTYLLMGLAQLPLIVAVAVETARSIADGRRDGQFSSFVQWLQVPTSIVTSFIQAAMTLLGNLGTAVVYFDIRGRQEAKDLDSAIDALDAGRNA